MTRDELQDAAAVRLEKAKRLICQWATGTGKSNIVLKFLRKHPEFNCLILVPEQDNIQNWYDEFIKFDVPYDKVRIVCYASFHKYKDTKWDLLVFDEMPHVDTEKRLAICKAVSGNYVLALGAVITWEERKSIEDVYGKYDLSWISMSKAIEMKILPSPTINVVHLQIPKQYRYKYDELQAKVANAKKAFDKNPAEFNRIRMLCAGSERKRFLGSIKDFVIRELCKNLESKGKRFLCFCSSIKQAEAIGEDHAFTSKTPVSMRLLEKFNNHEIDSLYVVGKLIEGQNLKDIDCGVIGQLGGTHRITVQSVGRIMRSDKPIIYAPIFDDTKDEDFLSTLIDNVPRNCIKHYKF